VQRGFQQLQHGGWEGRGATAFFGEMEREIFPAMRRLHAAPTAGADVVRQISEILHAAEEEAAQLFGSGILVSTDSLGLADSAGLRSPTILGTTNLFLH
jgi:WXG100 family type VII secretion target